MTPQKLVVEEYMNAFSVTDHARILACLTDDVVWEMPGFFYHQGKQAFDQEIENGKGDGNPDIVITRMMEEGDIVVAEGTVKATMKDGGMLNAVFCDVFHFSMGKISKLTSYVMFKK